RHLREAEPASRTEIGTRVAIFERIAQDFLAALDENLRSRALVYTPFYHPWLFVKSLLSAPFRAGARAVLIQSEYDKWFYDKNTLDQLPSLTPDRAAGAHPDAVFGPKLILNTTSLLSGERVPFSRVPVAGIKQMSRVNRNILRLSRVVGASSAVPGVFPPTVIQGDMLVDGGVCDNQGIEALMRENPPCDVLLVSDASGQMEAVDTMSAADLSVLLRVNSILQFQVRSKLIDVLVGWRQIDPARRFFGFIHLYLNLKDRAAVVHRTPSEYIPGIAQIRTDLDQFSHVEREALMYHGYTLIDAQLQEYCRPALDSYLVSGAPQRVPPLFRRDVQAKAGARQELLRDLGAGRQNVFLARSAHKHPARVWPLLAGGGLAGIGLLGGTLYRAPEMLRLGQKWIGQNITGLIPLPILQGADWVLNYLAMPKLSRLVEVLSGILSVAAVLALTLYLVSFPVYEIVRRIAVARDAQRYRSLTGVAPSTQWPPAAEPQDAGERSMGQAAGQG
ncbi:MAG: patatin-like phospholipase family protein, partial [Acidobacteria bacterium]|nr:patatin-like phospholipase family protein [Acidobacteriota bacterium]